MCMWTMPGTFKHYDPAALAIPRDLAPRIAQPTLTFSFGVRVALAAGYIMHFVALAEM